MCTSFTSSRVSSLKHRTCFVKHRKVLASRHGVRRRGCLPDHRSRANSSCTPSDPISNGRGGPRTGCVAAPRAGTRRVIPPAVHADGGRRRLAAASRQRRMEDFVGCFAHSREGVEGTLGDDEMGMQLLLQTATHGYPAHLPGAETPDTPSIGPTARADRRLAPNLPRGTPASRATGRQQKKTTKKAGCQRFRKTPGFERSTGYSVQKTMYRVHIWKKTSHFLQDRRF